MTRTIIEYFLRSVNDYLEVDNVVQAIRRLCAEKGISISALENEVGIGHGLVRKWDEVRPRVDSLKKVADYFGCTVDELLREEA